MLFEIEVGEASRRCDEHAQSKQVCPFRVLVFLFTWFFVVNAWLRSDTNWAVQDIWFGTPLRTSTTTLLATLEIGVLNAAACDCSKGGSRVFSNRPRLQAIACLVEMNSLAAFYVLLKLIFDFLWLQLRQLIFSYSLQSIQSFLENDDCLPWIAELLPEHCAFEDLNPEKHQRARFVSILELVALRSLGSLQSIEDQVIIFTIYNYHRLCFIELSFSNSRWVDPIFPLCNTNQCIVIPDDFLLKSFDIWEIVHELNNLVSGCLLDSSDNCLLCFL